MRHLALFGAGAILGLGIDALCVRYFPGGYRLHAICLANVCVLLGAMIVALL